MVQIIELFLRFDALSNNAQGKLARQNNRLVNTRDYTFSNGLVNHGRGINIAHSAHTITIDDHALEDLIRGDSVVSHIYQDGYIRNNIISMLTPVFPGDKVKGILTTDININDLVVSFQTVNRPLLWKFLSLSAANTPNVISDGGFRATQW